MGKLLTSTFDTHCRKCRKPINKGDEFWWNGPKQPFHVSCRPTFDPLTPEPAPRRTPTTNRRTPTTKPTYETHFNSWSAFVDQAEHGESEMRTISRSSRDTDRPDWFGGTDTFDDAVTLARSGWELELPRVQSFTSDILGEIRPNIDTAFHTLHDVTGCEVDIGRFVSGDPESMIELIPVKVSRAGRVISVHVQLNINWRVNIKKLLQRGAAIVALVDILSQLQHSVEIKAEFLLDSDKYRTNQTSSFTIDLKHATDQLDIANLIFAIAHPATHRRLMFSIMEQQSSEWRQLFHVPGGYAFNVSNISSDADIVLTKADHITNGKDWIIEHLTRFGLIGE